jgi:hypothetical protein
VPRTINVVSDNVLIGGFARQVKPITCALVRDVMSDFDLASRAVPDVAPDAAEIPPIVPQAVAPPAAAPTAVAAPTAAIAAAPVPPEPQAEAAAASGGPLFRLYNRRRFSFF